MDAEFDLTVLMKNNLYGFIRDMHVFLNIDRAYCAGYCTKSAFPSVLSLKSSPVPFIQNTESAAGCGLIQSQKSPDYRLQAR